MTKKFQFDNNADRRKSSALLYLVSIPFLAVSIFVISANVYRFEIVPFVVSTVVALILLALGVYCLKMGAKCTSFPNAVVVNSDGIEAMSDSVAEKIKYKDISTLCFDYVVAKFIGWEIMVVTKEHTTHTITFSKRHADLVELFVHIAKLVPSNSKLMFRMKPGSKSLIQKKVSELSDEIDELTNKCSGRTNAP